VRIRIFAIEGFLIFDEVPDAEAVLAAMADRVVDLGEISVVVE